MNDEEEATAAITPIAANEAREREETRRAFVIIHQLNVALSRPLALSTRVAAYNWADAGMTYLMRTIVTAAFTEAGWTVTKRDQELLFCEGPLPHGFLTTRLE